MSGSEIWLVFHERDGLLRRERSREAAALWSCALVAGEVSDRLRYDGDFWVFTIAWDEDHMVVTICTELAAAREGLSITQAPLYPDPLRPFTEVPR